MGKYLDLVLSVFKKSYDELTINIDDAFLYQKNMAKNSNNTAVKVYKYSQLVLQLAV